MEIPKLKIDVTIFGVALFESVCVIEHEQVVFETPSECM
jgi:hypothetical protein